jgi:hypothetical protein
MLVAVNIAIFTYEQPLCYGSDVTLQQRACTATPTFALKFTRA